MNPGKLIQLRECIEERRLDEEIWKMLSDYNFGTSFNVGQLHKDIKKVFLKIIEKKLDKE